MDDQLDVESMWNLARFCCDAYLLIWRRAGHVRNEMYHRNIEIGESGMHPYRNDLSALQDFASIVWENRG